jgi:hypothetical protein
MAQMPGWERWTGSASAKCGLDVEKYISPLRFSQKRGKLLRHASGVFAFFAVEE